MSEETLDTMPDIRELVTKLIWRKFSAPNPYFSVSFCLVFVGNEAIEAAEKSLLPFPEFKRNGLLHNVTPREKNGNMLKVYIPVLPLYEEGDKSYCGFAILLSGEHFCELQLKKGSNRAVCFREKNHILDEKSGEYKVYSGGTFGWGLPHPYKTHFKPSEHYVGLVEHRLQAQSSWPGFESVWLKCLEYPSYVAHYFKIEIKWVEVDSFTAAMVIISEKDREETPEELQNFTEFPNVRNI